MVITRDEADQLAEQISKQKQADLNKRQAIARAAAPALRKLALSDEIIALILNVPADTFKR